MKGFQFFSIVAEKCVGQNVGGRKKERKKERRRGIITRIGIAKQ
jgi:hypothetical protein